LLAQTIWRCGSDSRPLRWLAVLILLVMAAAPAQAGVPGCAVFAHGFEAGGAVPPSGESSISGRLLDTNDFVLGTETPIVGATVSVLNTNLSTISDASGFFTLTGIESTAPVIDMDTSTALPGPGGVTYAGFRELIDIEPCQVLMVERPFFLPRIDESSLTTVDPNAETVVINANIGVILTVPPHTAMMNGMEFTGQLSISEVPGGLAPAALPGNLQPGLLITIQPVGVVFNTPAPITFPNTDTLAVDGVLDIWSLDPNAGQFVVVGRGEVSSDGTSVDTTFGGVRAADWHFALPSAAEIEWELLFGPFAPFLAQAIRGSSEVGVQDGSLRIAHQLPSIRSLNADIAPRFQYDSRSAYPRPVLKNIIRLPRTSFIPLIPDQISSRVRVNFVQVGDELFTDTSTMSPVGSTDVVQSLQIDASGLPTGVHLYDFTTLSHFDSSTVGASVAGFMTVNNQGSSPFGAGWTLEELDRIQNPLGDNVVQLVRGTGEVIAFRRVIDFNFLQNPPIEIDCCVESIAAGDFNNDGYPDLVDVGGVDGGVIRLNDQNGNFVVSDSLELGTGSGEDVVTGFINGDANLDIAVCFGAFAQSRVRVFLGDGTGAFSQSAEIFVGDRPLELDLGDFDGNSTIDIVTANDFGGSVSLLSGDGNGGFGAAVEFNARGVATQGPNSIAVGDLNQDGNNDVAVAGQSAEMAVLYGDGSGNLGPPVSFNVNGNSDALIIGDFNNDALPDIAATATSGSGGFVQVYLGNGLGSFLSPIRTDVGDRPKSIAAGDLNLDGNLDLAVTNSDSDTVSVLLGLGNGAYFASKTISIPKIPILGEDHIAIADFNQDLYPDLAVLDEGGFPNDEIYIVDNTSVDSDEFTPPSHVFSKLFRNEDGSFRHVLPNGSRAEFDASGLQTALIDRFDNHVSYDYDGSGRLASITYPVGQVFTFEYLPGSVVITDPALRQTQFVIDGAGDLVQINSPDGGQLNYGYGVQHDLEMLTTAGGHVYNYQYDDHGMIQQVNVPNGEVRLFEPGLAEGLPQMPGQGTPGNPLPLIDNEDVVDLFTDGLGHETRFTTTRMGAMLTQRDALFRNVTFERDDRLLVTNIRLATNNQIHFTYDERGNLLTSTDAENGVSAYQYNGDNQLTLFTNPIGDQILLSYDDQGAMIAYDDGIVTLTNTFTPQGLISTSTDAQNNMVVYDYDADHNLSMFTDANGHSTQIFRDAAGNITSAIDHAGETAGFTFDDFNRLLTATNEQMEVTTYTYTPQGDIGTVTGPDGLLFTFEYDEVRNLTSQVDALNRETLYGYDVVRNLTSITNPNGSSVIYDYDVLNRMTDVTASTGEVASFEYSTLGKLDRMEDNDSLIEAQHDKMGRTTLITLNGGGTHSTQPADLSYSLTYNDAGQITDINQFDGTAVTYSYNARGDLTGITTPEIDHQLTVDTAGRFTTLASQITGGVASGFVRGYTPNDQLETLDIDINGAPAFSFAISLDDIGNRTGITDNAGARTYTYDLTGQLLTASHPDQVAEAYTYDDLGNRLTSAFTTGTIDYDAANQISQDSAFDYTFDANGNLITRTDLSTGDSIHYSYNAFDQVVEVDQQDNMAMTISLTTYAYDAMGRRIMKDVDGIVTKFAHQNQRLVASYDNSDVLLATYLPGPEPNMVLSMETMGEQFVVHRNTIGSVIAISDQFGSLVNQYSYDSFGRAVSETELVDYPFGFAGAEHDEETGLYYMRARYYDTFSGRFIQADGRSFTAGANLFHYVKNNPLSFTDPQGQAIYGAAIGASTNLLLQASLGRSSKKDTAPLDFGSFAFDVAMGAASCGAGNVLKGIGLHGIRTSYLHALKQAVLPQAGGSAVVDVLASVVTAYTSFSVSSEFKPDVFGSESFSEEQRLKDAIFNEVSYVAGRKFSDPYQDFADDSFRSVTDKSESRVQGGAYKSPYDK